MFGRGSIYLRSAFLLSDFCLGSFLYIHTQPSCSPIRIWEGFFTVRGFLLSGLGRLRCRGAGLCGDLAVPSSSPHAQRGLDHGDCPNSIDRCVCPGHLGLGGNSLLDSNVSSYSPKVSYQEGGSGEVCSAHVYWASNLIVASGQTSPSGTTPKKVKKSYL